MDEFDYVVVGAGSAGCVLAARLSENGSHKVALLEAGGEDDNFWIHTPLGYGRLYDDPNVNWMYESEPEAELNNVKLSQPRGKVLGGTGSINGNVYLRGLPDDFNYWQQLGNIGWSFDDVLPYFKKAEGNGRIHNEFHGNDGPFKVSDPPRTELYDAFIKAGVDAGYEATDDFNGGKFHGFGYNQLTTYKGRRWSPAAGYLKPARNRPNLKVILKALATRILFKDGRAVGIEYRQDGELRTVMAKREVILALGSFNSPQLLQLSGVGRADLLGEFGIDVVANMPGVGDNLQDHFGPAMVYRCTKPITVNDIVHSPIRRTLMGIQYLLFKTGFMTTNGSYVGANIRLHSDDPESEMKIKLGLWARDVSGHRAGVVGLMGLYPFPAFSLLISRQHPDSRGSVRIKSKDPTAAPEMRFNFFQSRNDRRFCVEAIKLGRKLMTMPSIAPYVGEEIQPGPQIVSDDDLVTYCRKRGRSTHHGVGTCKMGIDDKAVVDSRLRVRGLQNLRIVDGSVMPRIVAANTQAAIVMIAEKGSAMILEDARH